MSVFFYPPSSCSFPSRRSYHEIIINVRAIRAATSRSYAYMKSRVSYRVPVAIIYDSICVTMYETSRSPVGAHPRVSGTLWSQNVDPDRSRMSTCLRR